MPKKQHRKPPRRKQRVDRDDETSDLLTLSAALFEHRLDTNAQGWLTLPWRNGWNAVALAWDVGECLRFEKSGRFEFGHSAHVAHNWVWECMLAKRTDQAAYYKTDDLIETLPHTRETPPIRAALRLIQMTIADSSGGGHNYNHVLRRIAGDITEGHILQYRCQDVLGHSTKTPHSQELERLRQAFTIAWRRGLFHAAYAIPPLKPEFL